MVGTLVLKRPDSQVSECSGRDGAVLSDGGQDVALRPATAWALTTEHRVRVNGEDKFLSDADDVDALAAVRRRSGQNMTANAARFEDMAAAMRAANAETGAALEPGVGLAILRQE